MDTRLPDGSVSVINETGSTVRLTGNCVPDDAQTLNNGDKDSDVYPDSQCRVDDGDGLDGLLGCLQVGTSGTTTLRQSALTRIRNADDCGAGGRR